MECQDHARRTWETSLSGWNLSGALNEWWERQARWWEQQEQRSCGEEEPGVFKDQAGGAEW